jgi:hypothetical protein
MNAGAADAEKANDNTIMEIKKDAVPETVETKDVVPVQVPEN